MWECVVQKLSQQSYRILSWLIEISKFQVRMVSPHPQSKELLAAL